MARISGRRAYRLLQSIAYERLAASPEETKAAHTLAEEVETFGLKSEIETFKIWDYKIKTATLEVLEPFQATYEVKGYGLTGSTAAQGLEAELLYVEDAGDVNLQNAAGKIILMNEGLTVDKYEKLIKAKVAGFIMMGGPVWEWGDIPHRSIRDTHFKHCNIPAVSMLTADAFKMVKRKASKVRIVLQQDEFEADSRNVIAEIKGTKYPNEVILFGAHYDSVPYSSGANDNGAGSVIIMELARMFADKPPLRTVRFVWFGAEELGLLGSFAYVEKHEKELEEIKYVINVDVAGGFLGKNVALITANERVKGHVETLARQEGLEMDTRLDVYSSDSIPFADKGIPGINFCRFGAPIHNRHDVLQYISPARLEEMAAFVYKYADAVVNAKFFPVEREMTDGVKKNLKAYLERRNGKSKEEKKD